MNRSELNTLVDQTVASCKDILKLKGAEYSGSEDVLANFKRGAEKKGLTPLQVAGIYLDKHLDSIDTYLKNEARGIKQLLSEPIEGRFHDAINYILLMLAIEKEKAGAKVHNQPEENA